MLRCCLSFSPRVRQASPALVLAGIIADANKLLATLVHTTG